MDEQKVQTWRDLRFEAAILVALAVIVVIGRMVPGLGFERLWPLLLISTGLSGLCGPRRG